jgi:class 3 adenylate cyclase
VERSEVPSGVRSGPGRGTLLLVDISGYTAFFSAVEKAHAADMAAGTFTPEAYPLLTSLLDVIVERISPPFVLNKFEGDAVFAFASDDEMQLRGDAVITCLSNCYGAFRDRLDAARDLMPCSCDACSSIAGLEIKFVLHHGEYIAQAIAGHQELLGPDVTMTHVLLKNHVTDLIGRSAYALLTESAAAHLEVPIERALSITERYEHYPQIHGYVLKLP